METERTVSTSANIPLTYDRYKRRKEEIRKHREELKRKLSRIEAEMEKGKRESENHGQVDEEDGGVVRKKRKKNEKMTSLTLPQWHVLPVRSFKPTVGAIDLFSRSKKLSAKVKKEVDEAVEEFISTEDKFQLLQTLDRLHGLCLDKVTKIVLSRKDKGHYWNRKEFRIIRMNNRVLVSMRFKKATARIRSLNKNASREILQRGLNDLVSSRDLERTLQSSLLLLD